MFENKFSPRECIFEFLKLPISQSLALNIHAEDEDDANLENGKQDYNMSKPFEGEYPESGTLSVFNDSGNPLLA